MKKMLLIVAASLIIGIQATHKVNAMNGRHFQKIEDMFEKIECEHCTSECSTTEDFSSEGEDAQNQDSKETSSSNENGGEGRKNYKKQCSPNPRFPDDYCDLYISMYNLYFKDDYNKSRKDKKVVTALIQTHLDKIADSFLHPIDELYERLQSQTEFNYFISSKECYDAINLLGLSGDLTPEQVKRRQWIVNKILDNKSIQKDKKAKEVMNQLGLKTDSIR